MSSGKIRLKSNHFKTYHGEEPSIQQPVLKEGGKKSSRALLALLLFTLALQIFSIWNLELSGRDSPRGAGIAREMAVTSKY